MGRHSRFARVLRKQADLHGKREAQPEPEYSLSDQRWLAANDKPPNNNRGNHEGTRQHES
jgi:hypothetical protein